MFELVAATVVVVLAGVAVYIWLGNRRVDKRVSQVLDEIGDGKYGP